MSPFAADAPAAPVPYTECVNTCKDEVCCGYDAIDHDYHCGTQCSCFNVTTQGGGWNIECPCNAGFTSASQCTEQLSPTVWLAVILTGARLFLNIFSRAVPSPAFQPGSPSVFFFLLAVCFTVGTLLVLFIAWGFRCQDASDTTIDGDDGESRRARHRAPLLREVPDRAAAAARPPTQTRGDTEASVSSSLTGAGTGGGNSLQRRVCCVCLDKPLQVVLIPCGHACCCRKCSRMLDKCPLCRLDIQATQRFYF